MRVYYYSPLEAGLVEFPSGLMRLADSEEVTDPDKADVFVLPAILRHVGPARFPQLPYLAGRERRHVAWNLAEDVKIHYPCGPLYLRADATRALVNACSSVQGWPWPVDDLYAGQPAEFEYDVVFQGWASTPLTGAVCEAVKASGLKCHISIHNFFYGYHYYDPAYEHYRHSFIRTLRASRLSLVPRSIPDGVVRYRFYEAMSAGRVPVHFCDGRVLPFKDRIDYNRCTVHIPEANAARAGAIIKDWLTQHSDDEIRAMGEYGRASWQRWLNPAKWNDLFTEAVRDYTGIQA